MPSICNNEIMKSKSRAPLSGCAAFACFIYAYYGPWRNKILFKQSNPSIIFTTLTNRSFIHSAAAASASAHCTYTDKSLLLSTGAEKSAENKRSCSPVLFPGEKRATPCYLATSLWALPLLDLSSDTELWNCKCLLSDQEIDLKRSEAPSPDIIVAWSWWKDKLCENVAQYHPSLAISNLTGEAAVSNRLKAKHYLRKGMLRHAFTGLEVQRLRLHHLKAFKTTLMLYMVFSRNVTPVHFSRNLGIFSLLLKEYIYHRHITPVQAWLKYKPPPCWRGACIIMYV